MSGGTSDGCAALSGANGSLVAGDAAFDERLAAAGIAVPEDLRAGVLAGCRELARMAALLRAVPLAHADEPAAVYRVERDGDAAA